MIERLWRYLQGYVVLKIRGPKLERFLNRVARAGIGVWDVERLGAGMLVARVSLAGFRRVRLLCRSQGWKVSIADKVGLPFLGARLVRRKMLVVGGFLSLLGIYLASGYIWFVTVEADEGVPVDSILEVARQAGLRPGVSRRSVDRHQVQKALLLEIDELSWATVRLNGTLAVIEATRRTGLEPASTRPGDLVAARDGIVERVVVMSGRALVAQGDTVKRGDLLITGFIPPGDPEHQSLLEAGDPPYVRAEGIVLARIWYEGHAAVPLIQPMEEPTGARAWALELEWGKRRWRLGGPRSSFAAHQETRRTWRTRLGPEHAIGLHWVTYEEVDRQFVEVEAETAEEHARHAAEAQLLAELPPGATVIDGPNVTIEISLEQGRPVLVATARAEVIGDVATFKEIHF